MIADRKLCDQVQLMAFIMLYIGIALCLTIGTGVSCFIWTAQRQTITARKALIQSMLKQDVSWFDLQGMDTAAAILRFGLSHTT